MPALPGGIFLARRCLLDRQSHHAAASSAQVCRAHPGIQYDMPNNPEQDDILALSTVRLRQRQPSHHLLQSRCSISRG